MWCKTVSSIIAITSHCRYFKKRGLVTSNSTFWQYPDNQLQDNKNTSYLKTITSQQQHYHTDLTTQSNKRQHSYKKKHNPLRRTKLKRPAYLIQSQSQVTLWLAVYGQSVHLGNKPHWDSQPVIPFPPMNTCCLWWEDGSVIYNCC
jgi:hypothetical protein